MTDMTTETITEMPRFTTLQTEWNELLQASPSDGVFLTWEWLSTWWRHLSGDRRLHIIAVRRGKELIAIAPLAVRPRQLSRLLPFNTLEFLGSGIIGSDYLDIIVRHGCEQDACGALAEHFANDRRLLDLSQLNRKSCLAGELAARLGREGWSRRETQTNICPFIPLAGHTWPSFLATLGPQHQSNFEKQMRRLAKECDVRFVRVTEEARRPGALAQLIALHNLRWKDGVSEAFCSPALLAFHDDWTRIALEQGWLRLFVLNLNGRPTAALYGFRYGRRFYFFQSGFDPRFGTKHSVGHLTLGLAIQGALTEGAEEFDMLHGAEPYKFRWARETRELGRLELYPAGVPGRAMSTTMEISRQAKKMARRVLPGRWADRIALGGQIGSFSWRAS